MVIYVLDFQQLSDAQGDPLPRRRITMVGWIDLPQIHLHHASRLDRLDTIKRWIPSGALPQLNLLEHVVSLPHWIPTDI